MTSRSAALSCQSDHALPLDGPLRQQQEWQTAIGGPLDHLAVSGIGMSLTWPQVPLNLVEADSAAWQEHTCSRREEEEASAKEAG